jgi:hypothetical protein
MSTDLKIEVGQTSNLTVITQDFSSGDDKVAIWKVTPPLIAKSYGMSFDSISIDRTTATGNGVHKRLLINGLDNTSMTGHFSTYLKTNCEPIAKGAKGAKGVVWADEDSISAESKGVLHHRCQFLIQSASVQTPRKVTLDEFEKELSLINQAKLDDELDKLDFGPAATGTVVCTAAAPPVNSVAKYKLALESICSVIYKRAGIITPISLIYTIVLIQYSK